jgi:RNA polymerase sigma-70 factor, ECF subfamily
MSEHAGMPGPPGNSENNGSMIDILSTGPATEAIDLDAEQAKEPAAGHALTNKLAAAAVAGDIAARDQLIAELYPRVFRYCRARLGYRESVHCSADDVAQEVCLAVVTALHSYVVSGRSFRAFVYGIAANKVADAFRALGRDRSDPMTDLPDGPALHDDPEGCVLAGERAERLDALLQLLTPQQRKVLVLRIAVGLSAEETAEKLGSTPGAVRVTQHRALNRLRAAISGSGRSGRSSSPTPRRQSGQDGSATPPRRRQALRTSA